MPDFTKPKTMFLGILLLIVLIVLILFIINASNPDFISTYGANKTVGQAFDNGTYASFFILTAFFIFVIGYALLWIGKKEINKYLSLFNVLFLLGSIFMFFADMYIISMVLAFFSIQIFLANMFFGFTAKTKLKKKKLD